MTSLLLTLFVMSSIAIAALAIGLLWSSRGRNSRSTSQSGASLAVGTIALTAGNLPAGTSGVVASPLRRRVVMGVAVSITAGLGAALLWNAMTVPADRSEKPAPGSEQAAGIEDEALAQLKNYLRAVTIHPAADSGEKQSPLPDVGTMIERLAVRLQAAPSDVHGWRMLGWSYYHTAQYEQAVAAYERALMLDPQSDELRLSLETARAKADGADAQRAASPSGGSE